MNTLRWFAALVLAALLAPTASAYPPDYPNVIVPGHVTIVGHDQGVPDPAGRFGVMVMDIAGNPIHGAEVIVDFTNDPDVRIATDVVAPGAVVDCPSHTIRAFTDINGWAYFTIVGTASYGPPQCVAGSWCERNVRIYTYGWEIARIGASVMDLDGWAGVGGSDLALWLADFGAGLDPSWSDHDGDGVVGGPDLALWLATFGSGGSTDSAAAYCP